MKDKVTLSHRSGMAFEAEVNGHKMTIDSAREFGGNNEGPRPKSLMLVALAGCTGMDVASILKKMRIEFTDLSIKVEGNITEEHPKHFDHMHIVYTVKGDNIPREKVESAIIMSQDKYCGVSFTYKQAMNITWELIIE